MLKIVRQVLWVLNKMNSGKKAFEIVVVLMIVFFFLIITFRKEKVISENILSNKKEFNAEERTITGENDWPIFRGDQALRGHATGDFPEKLDIIWSFKTDGKIKSSAVISGGLAYVASGNGTVYAVYMDTGKQAWSFKCDDLGEAPPLFVDQKLIVASISGMVYALDSIKGNVIWKYKTEDRITGSPNFFLHNGKYRIIVGSHDNNLYCLDLEHGRIIFKYSTENFINGTPAVYGDVMVFGGCDSLCHIVSKNDGTKIATLEMGSYIAGSCAIEGGLAVTGNYDGELVCVDIEGMKIKWKYGDPDTGAFVSDPAIWNGSVFAGSRDKRLHCVELENGKVKWTFKTRGIIDSSPVIAGNKVIFASKDGWLYMVDTQTGKEIYNYEIGSPITASPAVVNGKVLIGAWDGYLYLLGENK